MNLYAQLLADVPRDDLMKAIARYLTESETRWFPAVGTLRRMAAESSQGMVADWEVAWDEILKASKVWSQFDKDKAMNAREMLGEGLMWFVKMLGGFYNIVNASSDELTVLQSNFRNAWTRQKQNAETLRKIPQPLRPRVTLPSEVSTHLESFGNLDRKKLEG